MFITILSGSPRPAEQTERPAGHGYE